MLRSFISGRVLATLAVAALAVPFAAAQERGENINGFITAVDGRNLVIKHDDGREVRIHVAPSTEVYFQDSGDRKLFPNPGIDDLRSGMGVHFNYNDGAPTRVVVHFVPEGFVRGSGSTATSGTEEYKARVQSIDRTGREITADVQGRSRTFAVENRRDLQGLRTGDMITIWVQDRGRGPVITRLESVDQTGTVVRIDPQYRSVTLNVNGREETYDVDNRKLLDSLREGDRVRFELANRGGRQLLTNVSRLDARDRRD